MDTAAGKTFQSGLTLGEQGVDCFQLFETSMGSHHMREKVARQRGITLPEVLVGIVLAIILTALFIPALSRSFRQSNLDTCAANLGVLYKAQQSPGTSFEAGSKYWLALPGMDSNTLLCPLRDTADPSPCDYWGPSEDPAGREETDPIGCDAPNNHSLDTREGINILLKSGRVVLVNNRSGQDGLYGSALGLGLCAP